MAICTIARSIIIIIIMFIIIIVIIIMCVVKYFSCVVEMLWLVLNDLRAQ